MNRKVEHIIVKYLMNSANIVELEALTDWLKKPKNKQVFKDYVKTNYAMDINMKQFDTEHAKKEYLRKIKQDKKRVHRLKFSKVFKYAAAAIVGGILATAYYYKDNGVSSAIEQTPTIVNTKTIVPGTDKATLTLGDGSLVVLDKGNTYQGQNATSNGEELIYTTNNQKSTEIVYNYLTIPRGGEYYVVLSDGTRVWLNSESQLKYPENFAEGETRIVELVYGEAYFDVTPSTDQKGAKFKVFNKSQEIEVLGTEFNVKAYEDETNIYTTLVEGEVEVSFENKKELLAPSEQLNIDVNTKKSIIAIVDVQSETSWKNGLFSFRGKPLKDIMKVVSRWYDVDVIFENKSLELIKFKGIIDKQQSIEEVLSIMKSSTINNFEIKDKTLILK